MKIERKATRKFWRFSVTECVIPTILAAVALSSCATQGTSAVERLIWLDYADSELVRADDVSRYRCTQGLLLVERLNITERKVTCGHTTPALLR